MAEQNTPTGPTDQELTGCRLGNYHLLRRLGRGGMADVYLAEQESLKRQVAFKVLRRSLAMDETYVKRFEKEAQAAASLVHANIVQIHEVGCIDGVHFIAQEYISGKNLGQYIERKGPAEVSMAVRVLRQVAAALHKASQQGIIHRDIKPENIMLTSDGEVKVTDFGLARVTANGEALNLTQEGITMGTPLYMSPEQVEGRVVDPRSDLYSLGVTLYHLLAGRPPFEGETPFGIAFQHVSKEPERLENLREDIPESLCRIVHRMMAKQPDDRYERSADLLRELRALQTEEDDGAWPDDIDDWTVPELVAMSETRNEATQQLESIMKREAATRESSRRRISVWLAGIVLAMTGGMGLAFVFRPKPLLTIEEPSAKSKRLATASQQYHHAVLVATEEEREAALLAVSDYFPAKDGPQNLYWSRRADERLAEHYLNNDEFDKALELYQRLARSEEGERQFRASGLIGEANVHALRGDMRRANELIIEVQPILRELSPSVRGALLARLNADLRKQVTALLPGA